MIDKKILYVYTGDHHVHRKFVKTITPHIVPLSKNLPNGFEVYFFEGAYAQPALLRMTRKINKNAKIITFFADPRLYYLGKRLIFDYKKDQLKRTARSKQKLSKFLIKKIDGALCEGSFNKNLFRRYNKTSPVKVIYPFIYDKTYKQLIKIKPELSSNNILFIGNGPDPYCKGLDILIEIFKKLQKEFPDSKLYVLGEDWKIKQEWIAKNIFFEGRRDIVPYLKKCSLLVHIGQGEGFGIPIIESMLAGVPAIVSEYTGAKDIVKKADKNLVAPLDKNVILEKIKNYFQEDIKTKEELSKKCRRATKELTEKNMLKKFKETFSELLEEVYDGNKAT